VEAELTTFSLTRQAEERLGIETARVEQRVVGRTRTYGGDLAIPPGRSVTVTAPVAGTLTGPGIGPVPMPGSSLRIEQEVLRLLPLEPPERDLVRMEAEALARIEAARSEARRSQQLLRDRAGSEKRVEAAQAELAIAEASLRAVENQRALLGQTTIGSEQGEISAFSLTSPLSGRMGEIHVVPGQTVTPAEPLFEVIREDTLWVRVPVYVGDLESIDRDQEVVVHGLGVAEAWNANEGGNGEDRPTDGAGSRRGIPVPSPPSADPQAATVDLFFRLDNREGSFQPGQKVAVTVPLRSGTEGDESLVIPRSAVLYDIHGGTWVYQRPAPQKYVRRRVEIRRVIGDQAVLARGPAEGSMIVIVGAAELFGTEFGVGK
jgi:multidrug efflux pump subunit AcrA (membrane-fusion protein)